MIPPCLLSLADLNDAAPGVLDVVFGPDGDFEGAPLFRGPVRLTDGRYVSMDWLLCQPWDLAIMHRMASLDLRVPSVAAARAGELLARGARALARDPRRTGNNPETYAWHQEWSLAITLHRATAEKWTAADAARLAALTLALAPRIAALGGGR